MTRRLFMWLTTITSVFLIVLALRTTAVSAHDAVLVRSTPENGEVLTESPTEVITWFEEELVSGESTLVIYNSKGVQVDNDDGGVDLNDPDHASMIVTLPPHLPDGSYTAQWHVLLLDDDATSGAFAFGVGEDTVLVPTPEEAPDDTADNLPTATIAAVVITLSIVLIGIAMLLRKRQS